jgi:hypothetical protein
MDTLTEEESKKLLNYIVMHGYTNMPSDIMAIYRKWLLLAFKEVK